MKFLPPSASSIAGQVDAITLGLILLSALILLTVFGLMGVFVLRFRRHAPGAPQRYQPKGQRRPWIEVIWMAVLLVISLGIFAKAGLAYFRMHQVPEGAEDVYVVAKQWMWKFQHADGTRELGLLHVPVGKPIRLIMTSQDVIHSLFVPAFRIKQDVLPGRYTETWFEATRPGEYVLFCSQYCGTSHADMRARVIALDPARFSAWKASGAAVPPGASLAAAGARHFSRLGCIHCHGAGSAVKAPDLSRVYGSWVELRTGTRVYADESYLRESILLPNAKIVRGYDSVMPSFEGQVSDEQLAELIAFLKEGAR